MLCSLLFVINNYLLLKSAKSQQLTIKKKQQSVSNHYFIGASVSTVSVHLRSVVKDLGIKY